jgi:hypothetical protein
MLLSYFLSIYKNKIMKHTKIVYKMVSGVRKSNRRVKLIKIHCMQIWKITMKSIVQLIYANKREKKKSGKQKSLHILYSNMNF